MNTINEFMMFYEFFWLEHLLFSIIFEDNILQLKEVISYCKEYDWDNELRYILLLDFIYR